MTFVRAFSALESQDFDKGEYNSLIELISDRNGSMSGGFVDQWDDLEPTTNINSSPAPFKIHYYRLRVYTSIPCVIYSSQVDNYWLAKQAPGGVDTLFNQLNMANNVVRKWDTTVTGGPWSKLSHSFTKRVWSKRRKHYVTVGKPLYMNDSVFKLQIKNIQPETAPAPGKYYAIVEVGLEYDAQ